MSAELLFNGNPRTESPQRPVPFTLQDIHSFEEALIYVRQQRNALSQSLKGKQPRGVAHALTWGRIVNELFSESFDQHPEYDHERMREIRERESLVFSAMLRSLGNPVDLSKMYGSLYQYEAQASFARGILERLSPEGEHALTQTPEPIALHPSSA